MNKINLENKLSYIFYDTYDSSERIGQSESMCKFQKRILLQKRTYIYQIPKSVFDINFLHIDSVLFGFKISTLVLFTRTISLY